MKNLKHVGKEKNTDRKCIVVFRQMYNEKGHVIDENNCLIVYSDQLPQAEHEEIMRIVEDTPMQESINAYEVFNRSRMSNGLNVLQWLHTCKPSRLIKTPTHNVILTPNNHTSLPLNHLNIILRMQQTGASKESIEEAIRREDQIIKDGQEPTDDLSRARSLLEKADSYESQAKAFREEAYTLSPELKPNSRKTTSKGKNESDGGGSDNAASKAA